MSLKKFLQSERRDLRQASLALPLLAVGALCLTAVLVRPQGITVDFPSFYAASGVLGQGGNPYDIHALRAYAEERGISSGVYPYLYPPFLASVIRPLTLLSPEAADLAWGVLIIVMFAMSAPLMAMVPGSGRPASLRDAALALGILLVLPVGQNIFMGQVNAIVLVCMTMAVLCSEREGTGWEWGAGLALAVGALIKVTPALLVVLFLARKKTAAVWSFFAASSAGLILSGAISGTEVWGQFLAFLPSMSYGRNIDGLFHPIVVGNISLSAFIMRLAEGSGQTVRLTATTASILLLGVLLRWIVRHRLSPGRHGLLLGLLIVMVIISPYAWIHHLVFLYPGAYLLFRDMLDRSPGSWRAVVLAGAVFAALTIDFPGLYPVMNIPELLRPSATSVNLILLLGMFALALRWAGWRGAGPGAPHHERREVGEAVLARVT